MLDDRLSSSPVRPEEFAGRWSFCDDGWLGTLTLSLDGGERVVGTFHSERFDEDYRVTGRIGGSAPHALDLAFHEFNWLDQQDYTGYLMTEGRRAIAGFSTWQRTPYGFFATRASRLLLGGYRPGVPRAEDYGGHWTAELDGERATVVLEADTASGHLRGTCAVQGAGTRFEVAGRQDPEIPHRATLSLIGDDGTASLEATGFLMSRPKNAVSGWISRPGAPGDRRGFFMVRFS